MGQCTIPADWQNYSQLSNVNLHPHSNSFSSLLLDAPLPSGDYHDVTELTWVNGEISMHGLGTPRVVIKPLSPDMWDNQRAGGTLESIVNQAANCLHPQPEFGGGDNTDKLLPLIEQNGAAAKPLKDALVPAASTLDTSTNDIYQVRDGDPRAGCGSISENGTCGWRESQHVTRRTSMDNTISADHSISHTNSHPTNKKTDDMEGKTKLSIGPSVSTKRSRAAATHNQSERKRRDKINQRIMTLQKMVPNSRKTDKASMLDEVIEYVKQLQGQVNMMRRMNMPSTMVPFLQQMQQLQMSMMGMAMDMNAINRAATAAVVPPVNYPAAASMPASWNNPADNLPTAPPAQGPVMPVAAIIGCQSQVSSILN